jgi:tellurite resistance protein TerC
VRGRRHATPLLILVIAIGVTDVLFAVDSIPAIFGLTHDPFLVFSANLFALLGLRHLYFLIGGLLNRLVYLSAGLAAILAFIGIKLIGEALRAYGIDHLGPVPVPGISAGVSLAVIAGILLITTVSSLASGRRAPDRDGADGRAGQAGRPGHDGQGHGRWSGRARQPGRGGHADEEGRPAPGHPQILPWAGPAPSIGPGRLAVIRPPVLPRPRGRPGHAAGPPPGPRRPSRRWPAG